MRSCWNRAAFAILGLALALPAGAAAQTVAFKGRGDIRTDALLRRILATGDYRLFAADTVLGKADTLDGHVLVTGATVKFENVIRGDLTLVDANVFLRPGARVTGAVTNIAGGFFRAPSATVDGEVTELKDAPYRAEVRSDGVAIRGLRAPSLIDPGGFRGLLPPTHDRVNGIGLHAGVGLLLPRLGSLEPEIRVRADYHAARERGGGTVELGLRSAGGVHARIGMDRVAATRDAWARSDFSNTVLFLGLGQDLRNYYDAERTYAAVDVRFPHRAGSAAIGLRAQVEDGRSLAARDPWHMSGDDPPRANPAIDDGRIASLELVVSADWSQPAFQAGLRLSAERAVREFDADFSFSAFDAAASWVMKALADHTYTLDTRFRGPLPGTATLPRQRWSALGGRGTLPTLEDLERTGDRMVFISSVYSIPVRAVDIPALGSPAIELVHHFGTAWSDDAAAATASGTRDFTHNLGIRLRFRLVSILAVTDPDESGPVTVSVGLGRAPLFPWSPREDR